MSFTTNKPTKEGGHKFAWTTQPADQSHSVPAFRPQVVRSVLMYPRLAAGVAIVVLLGLIGLALLQGAAYLATSQVYVEPAVARILGDPAATTFDAAKYESFLGEQIQLMQRLDVITAGLASLPASTYQEYGRSPAQAAAAIQAQMKVIRPASSYQVFISLKGSDAQKTADIVNAITSAYVAIVHKTNAEEYDQRAQLLGEERRRIETELQTARAEQTALGASIGVANPTEESGNPYDAELNGIRLQLTEARAAHDVAGAQLASLSGVGTSRTDGLTAAADELIAGDAGLGSMKATISQRKAQLGEQMSGMTTTNPIYKQDLDEMADLDRTLDRMTSDLRDKAARRLQDKLRTDLQRTGDIESRLNGQLARQIANATSAAPRLQRAGEVAADIKRLDTRLAAVDDALRSLRMEVSGPSQVRLSMPAKAPERPEASRKKLFLMLALPLALVLGGAAAILARKRDQHIYAGIDMEEVLGFPPLAVIPASADVSPRVFGEYVLRLAAGIESAYRNGGARTFVLTAVSMTTDIEPLTTSLTRKFEEIGVNVIVATASDMMSPIKASISSATAATATEVGDHGQTTAVWSEGFVAANVAKMKAEHGLVLIRSEAILNCAETEYVARCADATILMVECGVTTRQQLLLAGELLHRLNVSGVGAVLVEVELRFADAEFRKAIAALDRRQKASTQAERHQPASRSAVVDLAENRHEPPVEPPLAPIAVAQPVELVSAVTQDELEQAGASNELQSEATHYDEVLHHVRSAWPTEPEPGWHLPAFGQLNAAAETADVAREREIEPSIPVAEIDSDTTISESESSITEQMINNRQPALREEVLPRVSGRCHVPISGGDAGLARDESWLDKLLRRDSKAVVSIIPDESELDRSAENRDTSDTTLANRLAQVTEIDPLESAVAFTSKAVHQADVVDISQPHGAGTQRVMEETITREVEAHLIPEAVVQVLSMGADQPIVHEPAPVVAESAAVTEVAEVPAPKKFSPSSWTTADFEPVASVEELADGSQRAYTFRELIEKAQQVASAPVEHVSVETASVEAMAATEKLVQDSGFHVLGQVSEFVAAAPVVVSREVKADRAASIVSDSAASVALASEPAVLGQVEGVAQEVLVPVARPEPPTVWARAPEFRFAETRKPFLNPYDEVVAVSEHSVPETSDVDDIEPVYEAASRRLNSGRWDLIPPLRSSRANWRDRSSPAPFSRDSGGFRTDPTVKDAFNAFPPQCWIPEEDVFVPSEPEILSEPALSRQWGLLSKFQQSRLVSAGAGAGTEAGKDKGRDDFESQEPGSTHGNRKS